MPFRVCFKWGVSKDGIGEVNLRSCHDRGGGSSVRGQASVYTVVRKSDLDDLRLSNRNVARSTARHVETDVRISSVNRAQ